MIFREYKQRFEILYRLRVLKLKPSAVAKKCKVCLNTVKNIDRRFILSEDELKKILQKWRKSRSDTVLIEKFGNRKPTKITEFQRKKIEELCTKNLSCYLSPKEICDKIYAIDFELVYNYNPKKLDEKYRYRMYDDEKERIELCKFITRIRKSKSPKKNFQQVYEIFRKENSNESFEPSYHCFYQYARKYWKVDWKGKNFGELIDEMDFNDSDCL